ncbi:GDNF-inducible zinc finger protein 1 isoform X1 [Latimeria chalumnae]|uniref:GDNF-inducible zinc finger protein 1 isoform X1 n=1 Tax=Latimeria chalumnae TaxID=7897 RepID=UPI0003C12DC7|nr:PREDICTED: GDNF-inducible zinc finger protein 1-like isoform X2 [Latimeria chalumnae]|eukprot:XP_005991179.1 PREDICTED: GDNF-inducible zinc finger protein 1-like isoform X2 [Latimeria chalumnae]
MRRANDCKMEKHKVTMESKAAASNLLNALHKLYQFGHLCDATVQTEHHGIQEEFSVHKAVLAASSNYFKELFLSDEISNAKNTTVMLQDIYTEEFTSFLEFVYTAKIEIESDRLYRMKEIAERLECKDLLEVCEDIKAKTVGMGPDMKLESCKGRVVGCPLWDSAHQPEKVELASSSRIVAAPMKNRLWDRMKNRKSSEKNKFQLDPRATAKEATGTVSGPKTRSTRSFGYSKKGDSENDIGVDTNNSNQNDGSISEHTGQSDFKETRIFIKNVIPGQEEDENQKEAESLGKEQIRKSTRNASKRSTQAYVCDKCNQTFQYVKQYQTHMGAEHDINIVVKYSCDICAQLFSNHQNLRQHRLTVHTNERRFACIFCEKRFKSQKDINDHVRRVHEKKRTPQSCPYCDKIISSKCGLKVHIRTHTGEKPYKCNYCPASFAQRSAYNSHVRKIHESGQERKPRPIYWKIVPPADKSDDIVNFVVDVRETWDTPENTDLVGPASSNSNEEEVQESTSDAEVNCSNKSEEEKEKCGKEADENSAGEEIEEASLKDDDGSEEEAEDGAADDSDCEEAVKEDDEEEEEEEEVGSTEDEDYSNDKEAEENDSDEDYKIEKTSNQGKTKKLSYVINCDKCDEQFVSRKKYVVHCKDVHQSLPGKVYQCEICSKSFASYNSWKEHRACVHTEERQFACTLCNATFKRKRDVRTHYMRKHEGRVKRPLCSVCGKILSSRTALVFHMRTHTGEKPYECSICHSRFAQPSQLKIHIRSHTGERPYICEDCGACFADKGKLNGHKRTHTGERLFKCDVCGKHFATNEYLKCHKRCHMGAKPYKCEVCGKTFGLRASLAQHSNVHAETRPYFCEQCGKTFTQQGALRRHQRIHTGEKPYKCKACERLFTDMSTLRRHVSVHDRNAHWRTYLIDLTTKKDHNWSKIETVAYACVDDPVSDFWITNQEKPYKSESMNTENTGNSFMSL